ncbi:MAG: tetratricopeptide repeat protein, partial [Desulfovibrio sp.]
RTLPTKFRLGERGTLLLVDSPEANLERVHLLLKELAELDARAPRIRLLLLTRSTLGEWLERLDCCGASNLLHQQAIELAPGIAPLTPDEGLEIVNSAQESIGNLELVSGDSQLRPFCREHVAAWMDQGDLHRLPLFLVAAGVHSSLSPEDDTLSFSGPKIVDLLVRREILRLRNISKDLGLDEDALPRLFAVATIAGGMAWDALCADREAQERIGISTDKRTRKHLSQAGWLRNIALGKKQPDADGQEEESSVPGFAAVTPDIVGAAFVVKVLSDAGNAAQELADGGARLAVDPEEFINTLARLDYDARFVLGLKHLHSLSEWLRLAVERNGERCSKLKAFAYNSLPHTLAPLGAVICKGLLQGNLPDPERATLLNNLSIHLDASGDTPGALKAIQEAVDIRRELAKQDPERFRPDLARSLNNLSNRLAASGDNQGALKVIQEAVDIYRELAKQDPERFRPDLASSLNNLSVRLAESGKHDAALQSIQEAVDIRRELAKQDSARFRPDLARSLINLSLRLAESVDNPGALMDIQEAVDIRSELAETYPARFRPDLAQSLNNLSLCRADSDDTPGALKASKEAVDIRRELAVEKPARFRPDLASSLNNLSNCLAESGDTPGALKASQEAVDIYRELADENPARFRPDLARSLGAQGSILLRSGDQPAAAACFKQGLELMRPFAEANPGTPHETLFLALKELYKQATKPDNGAED